MRGGFCRRELRHSLRLRKTCKLTPHSYVLRGAVISPSSSLIVSLRIPDATKVNTRKSPPLPSNARGARCRGFGLGWHHLKSEIHALVLRLRAWCLALRSQTFATRAEAYQTCTTGSRLENGSRKMRIDFEIAFKLLAVTSLS